MSDTKSESTAFTGALTGEIVSQFANEFIASSKNMLAMNAVTRVEPIDVAVNRSKWNELSHHTYSHKLDTEFKVTNQKSSGRCWLFAQLNVMRVPFAAAYGLDTFEFSQTYLFFWDKLERANYFMECILSTIHEAPDSRIVHHLLEQPIGDGGQFEMLSGLIAKYGLVPKSVYPESIASSNSAHLNALLKHVLRGAAAKMHGLYQAGVKAKTIPLHATAKSKSGADAAFAVQFRADVVVPTMKVVYRILCIQLGVPPAKFDWTYRTKKDAKAKDDKTKETATAAASDADAKATPATSESAAASATVGSTPTKKSGGGKNKSADGGGDAKSKASKFVREIDLTPLSFYTKFVLPACGNVLDGVSLVHDPRNPYWKLYTVQYLGNIVNAGGDVGDAAGKGGVRYVNVPIEVLKQAVRDRLTGAPPPAAETATAAAPAASPAAGTPSPVWFGCDVGKCFHRKGQIMSTEMFEYRLVYDTDTIYGTNFSKADRLIYGESLMTHAMTFTGIDIHPVTNQILKYRVENSWGEQNGDKGYATMSDAWFSEYVYQVVIDRKFCSKEILKVRDEQTPIVLPAWDPLGALATL